jgi:hypothetical protein
VTVYDKTYWVRKKGSNRPGMPNGFLLGNGGKFFQKTACAVAYAGGESLDSFLAKNPDCEAVEVVRKGIRRYHGRDLFNWVPVKEA